MSVCDGGAAAVKALVQGHFHRLVEAGLPRNEAALKALELAQAEARGATNGTAVSSSSSAAPAPAPSPAPETVLAARSLSSAMGASKYGPLCLGLAGPFQSICVVGESRPGKHLLVLDIDHTIYDPSSHEGTKGSVVNSNADGFFDESVIARCRPGLHEFLTDVYQAYDIMVWSASDMLRILTLLQQLGIVGGGHSSYRVVAVLDVDSMSELSQPAPVANSAAVPGAEGTLVQAITVPSGAVPGQQIEARSVTDGSPMVVMVPPGLKPGDVFHVTIPGAVSSMSEELGVDADEVQLALQLSMGHVPAETQDGAARAPVAPLPKARRKSSRVKPLSLIWACGEFQTLYSEKNTVIIDDTVDVCSANPHNSIQCSRYFLKDHTTDEELPRLSKYLLHIAAQPELPSSHEHWREAAR